MFVMLFRTMDSAHIVYPFKPVFFHRIMISSDIMAGTIYFGERAASHVVQKTPASWIKYEFQPNSVSSAEFTCKFVQSNNFKHKVFCSYCSVKQVRLFEWICSPLCYLDSCLLLFCCLNWAQQGVFWQLGFWSAIGYGRWKWIWQASLSQ